MPIRLLGIGLPVTIALGAVAAALIVDQLTIGEAVILAVLLAPTDAALGQAVVTELRVPARVRQGLNIESGLNDLPGTVGLSTLPSDPATIEAIDRGTSVSTPRLSPPTGRSLPALSGWSPCRKRCPTRSTWRTR